MNRPEKKQVFSHLAEVGVALAVVWMMVQLFSVYRDFERESFPVTEFLQVVELRIPDHEVGDNPQIKYQRNILQPFRGFWVAEIQKRSGSGVETICYGPGAANYDPNDRLPDDLRLEWIMAKDCNVPAGEYRIEVGWDIIAEGYPLKQLSYFSNWFTVTEPQ